MKTILLTRGLVAVVDNKDFKHLNQFKWHAHFTRKRVYAARNVPRPGGGYQVRKMHREILGITDPKVKVDHHNAHGLDNRRKNLRVATESQNNANNRKREGTTSRFKGVHQRKDSGRFMARVGSSYLGTFDSEIIAAQTYNKAATERFGKFARLNHLP